MTNVCQCNFSEVMRGKAHGSEERVRGKEGSLWTDLLKKFDYEAMKKNMTVAPGGFWVKEPQK